MKRRPLRRRGMSLVEVLVALSISAMLLTAVGVAFSATLNVIENNDQFFRASQAARVSMNQILNGIRWCQSGVVETNSLELNVATGATRTYQFDPDARTLYMSISGQTVAPVPLAHNVTAMTFTTDGASIAVSMTVEIKANKITLNGSAVPRRNVTYAN